MKTKRQLTNRILSLVLAFVMVLGMIPMMSLTAHAATYNDDVYVLQVNSMEDYWWNSSELYKSYEVVGITDVTISVNANNQIVCSFKTKYYTDGKLMTSPKSYSFRVENKSCTEAISHEFVASFYYGSGDNFTHEAKGTLTRAARTEHIGGQNTCVAGAVCSICGTQYGSANSSAHNWGDWTYSEDGKHIRTCTLNSAHTESGNCDHKAATCLAASACSICKHEYAAQLEHNYTYTPNGNVLTQNCNNGCGHSATATLTATDATYTGSAITTGADVFYSDNWAGSKEHGEIIYSNNLNVGDATAKVTVAGKELTATYKITSKELTSNMVTLSPANSNYTGSAIAKPAVTAQDGTAMTANDYTVTWPNDADWTNVGTITVTVTGQNNYTGSVTKDFVIGKGTPTKELFNVTLPENPVYDGTTTFAADVTSGAPGLGAFIVKYKGSTDAPINAGTYNVTVDVAEGDNYNAATVELGSFTIQQTDGEASVSVANHEYGDTLPPIPVSSTNGTDAVTYQYKVKGADDSTYTNTVPSLPGYYTVKANFPATTNYKATEATADFTISKRAVTATVTAQNKTYNGTTDAVITATVEDVAYSDTFEISGLTGAFSDANAGEGKTVTVDSSNASVTGINVDYYVVSFPTTTTATITKAAAPTITFPEVLNAITYGQKLEEAKLSFYTNDYGTFNWNAPTAYPGEAGTIGYALDFYPNELALQNYDWKDAGEAQWIASRNALCICPDVTVNKAASTITTAPTANILTYNGEDQTLITAGSTSDGTMVYSLEKEGEYFETLPEAKTAGRYKVWYKVNGDKNHEDSAPVPVEVEIYKADPGIDAVTAGVVNDTLETSAIVLTRENTDIDGNLTVDAEQTLSLGENTIHYTFTPTDGTNYKVVKGEVTVTVVDTIAPTGTVTISTKSWAEFLNDITFSLFFKETQSVSVTASDNLSGVAKIEYIESKTPMDLDAVKAAPQWTEMKNGSVSVTLEDTKQFIYYIRITDKSGNIAYLSSDGAEYDTTAPVIAGVDNGVTYYTTQSVTVTDKNIDTITLNGETATGSIILEGNKEATYTIVATDKAGNSTTVTVTMKPIKVLAEATDGLNHDNVTSADSPALEALVEKLDELLADEDVSEDGEKETLEQHKTVAESLLQTIEKNAAEQKVVTDKAAQFDEDAVKSTDKAELEKVAEDIDTLLDTNNLTQDERTALETLLEQVEGMTDTIDKTAADSKAATDAIDALEPEAIKSTDKAAVEAALETIENLLDGDHLTEDERKVLEDAEADAEALIEIIEAAQDVTDSITQLPETVEPDDEETAEKILDAKEAYDDLTDYEKSLVDETTKKKLDDLVAALTAYDIIKGDGGKWTKGSSSDPSFTANGPFSKFVGIEVDGKEVDAKYYDAKAGSTIITLKQSFLKRLSTGEHTITVLYTDGETSGTFKILAESSTPATGDNSNIMLWSGMLCVSTLGLVVLLADRKRRRSTK